MPADYDLPMCDPLQSYPMPAPERRVNRTESPTSMSNAASSHSTHEDNQTSQNAFHTTQQPFYTFHNSTQVSDNGSVLPLCDPLQSYPMPAPDLRCNRTDRTSPVSEYSQSYCGFDGSHSSVSDHTDRNPLPEQQYPTSYAPSAPMDDLDLPPSYEEAMSQSNAHVKLNQSK